MRARLKRVRGTANVFLDVCFDKAQAENLKLRSELMMRIALLKGRIGLFSLDALVNVASRAGLNVRLVVKKAA
jgi:predicted XRE-type DNA-binding protein